MNKVGLFLSIVLLFLIMTLLPFPLLASIDYTCQSDCTDKGYQYDFCQSKCSYDDAGSFGKFKQKDYSCMDDCTDNGYMYQFCQDRCSY